MVDMKTKHCWTMTFEALDLPLVARRVPPLASRWKRADRVKLANLRMTDEDSRHEMKKPIQIEMLVYLVTSVMRVEKEMVG